MPADETSNGKVSWRDFVDRLDRRDAEMRAEMAALSSNVSRENAQTREMIQRLSDRIDNLPCHDHDHEIKDLQTDLSARPTWSGLFKLANKKTLAFLAFVAATAGWDGLSRLIQWWTEQQ